MPIHTRGNLVPERRVLFPQRAYYLMYVSCGCAPGLWLDFQWVLRATDDCEPVVCV